MECADFFFSKRPNMALGLNIDTLTRWRIDTLDIDTLTRWHTTHWNFDTLNIEHWTTTHWQFDTLTHWNIDTLRHWHIDTWHINRRIEHWHIQMPMEFAHWHIEHRIYRCIIYTLTHWTGIWHIELEYTDLTPDRNLKDNPCKQNSQENLKITQTRSGLQRKFPSGFLQVSFKFPFRFLWVLFITSSSFV